MNDWIGILPTMHGRDSSGQDFPTITYYTVVSDKQPCMFRNQFTEEKYKKKHKTWFMFYVKRPDREEFIFRKYV
jgi:hypothetical protein